MNYVKDMVNNLNTAASEIDHSLDQYYDHSNNT